MLHQGNSGTAMRYAYPSAKDVASRELREVLASTEALLAALGEEHGPVVEEMRDRLETTIADVRQQLGTSFFANARETISKARDTATSLDAFVNQRPWTSVALGVGAGFLIGIIFRGD
jgi:ElaB/YqjD/DUF883 family membrane-anchored ribosome-binding protein